MVQLKIWLQIAAFLAMASLVHRASSAKVLFLMPIATKSETHLLNPMAEAMLSRGHHVTLVTPASSSIKHANLTEIIPTAPLDLNDFDPKKHANVLDIRREKDDMAAMFSMDFSFVSNLCQQTYQHKDFAQVLQAESYDLALTSIWLSECFLGIFHKLNTPFIQISSMAVPMEALEATGLRTPLSFVPSPFFEFTDKMSFSERLANTMGSWSFYIMSHLFFYPIAEQVGKQQFGEGLPSVNAMRKNVSMIFSNTHFSLNFPRPLMPDTVEIGGVHTRKAKPLPKDIEEFCSGGNDGFIFFSLGTVFREETLPEHVKPMFINVFSRLKTRVLWKWKSEIKGLPNNVKVSCWLPQQDVLGHSKIRAFISHGGLLSTQEATFHGVPVLGIPLFVDQDVNVKQVEARGYGLKLEILEITEEYLESSIRRILDDAKYAKNAKMASAIFRDQPQTPLERAVYWMEYLIKYKGAPQPRSHARSPSYFEYYLYDVELILLSILGVIIYILWKLISTCLSCLGFGKSKKMSKGNRAKKNQ